LFEADWRDRELNLKVEVEREKEKQKKGSTRSKSLLPFEEFVYEAFASA
jgi:hypothetical protein